MGWFSKTKQKAEPNIKKKIEPLTKCPVCGEDTFVKVTTFVQYSEMKSIGDLKLLEENEADCNKYTGDQTGHCKKCGIVAHGWIVANSTSGSSNSYIIKHFNKAFLNAVTTTNKEVGNGTMPNNIKTMSSLAVELRMDPFFGVLKSDFAIGYYLLLMLIANGAIKLTDSFQQQYNLLLTVRDLLTPDDYSKIPKKEGETLLNAHEKLRILLQNGLPQFFK
jgi:hypothetical protein